LNIQKINIQFNLNSNNVIIIFDMLYTFIRNQIEQCLLVCDG